MVLHTYIVVYGNEVRNHGSFLFSNDEILITTLLLKYI